MFTVINTGNVTLEDVTITDTKLGLTDVSVSPSTLEPGDEGVYRHIYKVSQEDVSQLFVVVALLIRSFLLEVSHDQAIKK